MKHNIFSRDGELWLMEGEVPRSPAPIANAVPLYLAELERLKASAIRIGNKDEVMKIALPLFKGDRSFDPKYFLTDFIYEIEAEVRIMRLDHERDHDNGLEIVSSEHIAFLRPVVREESQGFPLPSEQQKKDGWNFSFEFMDEIAEYCEAVRGIDERPSLDEIDAVLSFVKSKFTITRNSTKER